MKGMRVVYQRWEESERGWGVKPDGFSLHISMEDLRHYLEVYHATLPDDHVPDCYERTTGKPIWAEIPLEYYNYIKNCTGDRKSLRCSANVKSSGVYEYLNNIVRESILEAVKQIETERSLTRGDPDG